MREAVRGYASAVLDQVATPDLAGVAGALGRFDAAVGSSDDLSRVLSDDGLSVGVRASIVEDLLAPAPPEVRHLARFAVRAEPAGDFLGDLGWLAGRAHDESAYRDGGADPDPPGGHQAINERLEGYALALFERLDDDAVVDEVEDQLFRMARIIESDKALDETLGDFDLPVPLRAGIVRDLTSGRAEDATVALLAYAVRVNRGQLVGHLDWLSTKVAEERGRRKAEVTTAAPIDEAQRLRLANALSELTGRKVSLRVTVDPSLVGGLKAVVGDIVLDGTVRHRLEQVRAVLAKESGLHARAGRSETGKERSN